MPAPYYFINSIDYERFTHHAGITVSILPTRIYKTYAKSFAITSAYSVGYNLIDSFNKDKQKYLSFTGSFSFGDLKPAPNEKNKKNVTFLSR